MYDFSVAPEPFFDNDIQWYKTNFPSFLIMLNSDARCRHNERIKHTQIYIFAFRIGWVRGSCITTKFGLSAKSKSFIFHAIICSLLSLQNAKHPPTGSPKIVYTLSACLLKISNHLAYRWFVDIRENKTKLNGRKIIQKFYSRK